MNFSIFTLHYHPLSFLEETLENNYKIFKKEKVKFKHYLLDNNFPLEKQKEKIKKICEDYNIHYMNAGKNLGSMSGYKFFNEEVKVKDIFINLESDVYLLTENLLTNIEKLNQKNNIKNLIYLNNKNLNDHEKNIFKINEINLFELNTENSNHTWVQCFFYNENGISELKKILLKDKRESYDVPGEKNHEFKKENAPILILNDFYEDMERYRFQNYFEYEYYKSFVYYWSKMEKEYEKITFEYFIENYDYFFEMEDKFSGSFQNLKKRTKNEIIFPKFYFEKTKIKFQKLNMQSIINNRLYKSKKNFLKESAKLQS